MTRSVLRPIRTRRIARSSTPPANETQHANAITPGTRKTLAAIGALWVSFAVSASVSPASASPVSPLSANPTSTSTAPGAQLTPARAGDEIELYANSQAPRIQKVAADHRRPAADAPRANTDRFAARESRETVFLTTGTPADRSMSRTPAPASRVTSSTALAYLKSLSK